MKAMLNALSFFLLCLGAYYIGLVFQAPKEELSLATLSSHGSHHSQQTDAPALVEELLEEVMEAPDDVPEPPSEVSHSLEEKIQQTNPLARGWGEDIDWIPTYEDALKMAKSRQKPLMVIHHLEECPFCQDLKAAFSAHEEIQKMAKKDFIMFNVMHETDDRNLSPDGYYVPRIIFIDPTLVIRMDITGKSTTHKYSYTHRDVELLMENMKKARIPHNFEL